MPGILTHSPADILRYALIDQSLGTLPTDGSSWPIFVSVEADTPDDAITVFDTTSIHQGRTQNDGRVYELYGAQIRVRSQNHVDGYTKAQAITIALDEDIYQQLVNIGGTTYVVWQVSRTSGVLALGKQTPSSKRDIFTINVAAADVSNAGSSTNQGYHRNSTRVVHS